MKEEFFFFFGNLKALLIYGKNFFSIKTGIKPSATIGHPKRVSIGKGVVICERTKILGHGGIEIGNDCLISFDVAILSSDHGTERGHLISKQKDILNKTILKEDVWIGCHSVVLAGVTINQGAVIGANSTVTKDVPASEIWAGNPAKKIGIRKR